MEYMAPDPDPDAPLSVHYLRSDVVDAALDVLCEGETLSQMFTRCASAEIIARCRHDLAGPLACAITGPTAPVELDLPDALRVLLGGVLREGETLRGIITALFIAEIRVRRTGMFWPVAAADEPVMPDDAARIEALILCG